MNNPTHKQIVSFLEVCRDFHFSKAAERLGVAQPQLSRTIRELEQFLGEALFFRRGRKVDLTASGQVFLKEVYQLPAVLSRAVEGARRAGSGEKSLLRLGFVGALMGEELLGVFERYRKEHPDTQLSLVDMAPVELLSKVSEGELDGAFLGVRPASLPPRVRCINWKEGSVRVCLPKGHRLAGRKRLRIKDVEGESLIALKLELAPAYREFLDGIYATAGIEAPGIRETNGAAAMASMVVAGCGVALLPASAVKGMDPYLTSIPLAGDGCRLREVFVSSERENPELRKFETCLPRARSKGINSSS